MAPGMTCQYVVQFLPDCLGDFDDFLSVETQAAHSLRIPLQARRPPPVLTRACALPPPRCSSGRRVPVSTAGPQGPLGPQRVGCGGGLLGESWLWLGPLTYKPLRWGTAWKLGL